MIPINRPSIDKKDITAFIRGHSKEFISKLEEEFSQYIGKEHAVFTSSCRSALYLTYKSLKIDGEIIVPPLTCSIALLPIIYCGLKIRFADIDPQTYNIDPEKINEMVAKNTSAIQVIHLAGDPCDMDEIKEIAEDHNIQIIEDCAQALGAEYHGKKVGSFGEISCFSFTKNLYGTGGGVIATDNKRIALKIKNIQQNFRSFPTSLRYYRFARNFLEEKGGNIFTDLLNTILLRFKDGVISVGKNCNPNSSPRLYKPSNIEASTCLLQIKKLDNLLEKRIKNASLITEKLSQVGNVETQMCTKGAKHVFTKYMLKTRFDCRDIIRKLREKGIDAMHLEYRPGNGYQERFDRDPLYSRFDSIKDCKNYLNIHDHIVSLPISSNMLDDEIKYISQQLKEVIGGKSYENTL